MPDFMLDNEGEDLNEIITVKGEKYVVGFGYFDPSTVNIYEYEEDFGGTVIDRNVPYLLMKIEENNNVLYDHLIMLSGYTAEERRKLNLHAKFKAEQYKKLKDIQLFIESDKNQAKEISRLTNKLCFCSSTDELFGKQ